MRRSILSTAMLLLVMTSAANANALDNSSLSSDLSAEMEAMKQEAMTQVQQENVKAIADKDALLVNYIKQEQSQLVNLKCQQKGNEES
ncbi:hypothetical protein [Vibrio navarrensis]|uniref:Chemotaxis protein n=1 Tax=Vibrio navarrensis TaxID=29495 RepID=A0A099LXC9_9VIBR|nr:hypothetical protein [Vibrio navarrensis]EJK2114664.1 hypothetical protein [Vibrio navarrensis]KGK12319.1 hypothetical protein EA26_13740 [Vibrio navarrensis]KGK19571.1 hypothetical protein EA25_01260 [Vibrio navarrensis]MBE3664293.1 hypothetical protein [Vibrio navarrensis]MBE4572508.1 hypothetical protein [Vibrio navarrensis]